MVVIVGTDRPKGNARQYNIALPSSSFLKKKVRSTRPKAAPRTVIEILGARKRRRDRAEEIKARIAALRRHVRAECDKMGKELKMKRKYFEDMFYQGGVRLTKPRNGTSNYNAFLAVKAHERREAGLSPKPLLELQNELGVEYHALTEKQLAEIREKYEAIRDVDALERIKRPSMKEKAADVARSVSHIVGILRGLKIRVGIEAVLCIVKNRAEKYMNPQWIQTDKRLGEYLELMVRGFDMGSVGRKLEAFSVAGFDATKVIKSSKEQADSLKRDTARLIQDQLDDKCGTKNLTIQYPKFDTLITMVYHVVCEGWPAHLPFKAPGNYGTSLAPLMELFDLWKNGTIRFRKLSNEEFEEWRVKRREGLESGAIAPPKARKKRSDAGVPRKKKSQEAKKVRAEESDVDEDEDDDDELPEVLSTTKTSVKKAAIEKPAKSAKPAAKEKPTKAAPKNRKPAKHVEAAHEDDTTPPSKPDRPRPTPRRVVPQHPDPGPASSSNAVADEDVGMDVGVNNGATPHNELQDALPESVDDLNIDPVLRNLGHTASPSSDSPNPPNGDTPRDTSEERQTEMAGRKRKALVEANEALASSDGREASVISEESELMGGGRSRRKRSAPKAKHFGASDHPALTRVFGKGNVNSDDDGDSDGDE
ncbi:hypothetical protein V5O48_015659 [Marasmius crinis-equi]|uniref:Uncharacterized protein n=1 Tax=Marasmius crinis-equi TaxID=585013 RepID=A0ABR3EU75_9AGAR